MNDRGGEGNPGDVHFFGQTAAIAPFTVIAGLLLGCAGARSGAILGDVAPGTTAIHVINHVAAPGELDRLTIAVDGDTVPLASIPPEGGASAVIARLRLAPGPHTIAVRVKAHAPRSDVLVVGAQQPFHVGRGPASITIDVRSQGVTFDAGATGATAPIVVSLAIVGGRMAPEIGVAPSADKDQRCASLLPIPRAICRAAVDLDEATRSNDIVAAFCVRDKLSEMRRLAIVGESGRGDAVTMAEAEVAALSQQVDRCAGVSTAPQPDGLRVLPPSRQ